jgi:hypothetical protein
MPKKKVHKLEAQGGEAERQRGREAESGWEGFWQPRQHGNAETRLAEAVKVEAGTAAVAGGAPTSGRSQPDIDEYGAPARTTHAQH